MIFALKIYKIPEFYMIFARKIPEFYLIIARKLLNPNFRGACAPLPPPLPPSPSPILHCRNSKLINYRMTAGDDVLIVFALLVKQRSQVK